MYKEKPLKISKKKKMKLDKGYQGIQKIHAWSEVPIKKKRKQKLAKEERRFNRQLSSERTPVEHVNRLIKIFRIFSSRYRNKRKRFGIRINLVAAIINMLL